MARLHLFQAPVQVKAPVQSLQKPDKSDSLRRWSAGFAGSVAIHALLALGAGMIGSASLAPQATLIPIDVVPIDRMANHPENAPSVATLSTTSPTVAPASASPQFSQPSSQPPSEVTSQPPNSGLAPITDLPQPASPPIALSQADPVPSSLPNSSPKIEVSAPSPQTINAPPLPISPSPQLPIPSATPQIDAPKPTLYAARVSVGALSLRDVAEQGAKPKTIRQEFTANGATCPTASASGSHFGQPVGLMVTVDDRGRVVAGDTVVQEPVDRGEYDRLALCLVNAWEFEPASNGGSAVWSNVLVRVTVDEL